MKTPWALETIWPDDEVVLFDSGTFLGYSPANEYKLRVNSIEVVDAKWELWVSVAHLFSPSLATKLIVVEQMKAKFEL